MELATEQANGADACAAAERAAAATAMQSLAGAPLQTDMPLGLEGSGNEILKRASRSYAAERNASGTLVAHKLELLRQYDAPGMQRAVNICFWSRSGSFLLASYLDSHDHVVLLPENRSDFIYAFHAEFASLSVWEKLVAYPEYAKAKYPRTGDFFGGNFPLAAADYYAAVRALYTLHGGRPEEWLRARVRFLQFLYVAYAVAAGRRPGTTRPLIVYGQHYSNDKLARAFVTDFPDGRFVHTIRDPISALDSWFDRSVISTYPPDQYPSPAVECVRELLACDRPHLGMEERTRAIRFEDLHLAPEASMRRLAEWLGIPYHACLIESTYNGAPFVFESGGILMHGAIPANARRRSKNLDAADRWLMFALLHQNFRAWSYACPRILRHGWLRLGVIAALLLVPMKMEIITARLVMRQRALPAWRERRIRFGLGAFVFLIGRRLRMMLLIGSEARARLAGKKRLLQLL